VIETPYGDKRIKLPPGDAILYPTTMLHRVEEVVTGERLAAVTWIQSMVQDQAKRSTSLLSFIGFKPRLRRARSTTG
jgi:PKHD-type hydroxylase